ncbi:uncharacterized protein LOC126908081 isoform X2 [Daktulosphaira vitifoliae]|nr:uncharacterized protein LOC126908081 isoform X2 [Daktulosphaira vitifoliae]
MAQKVCSKDGLYVTQYVSSSTAQNVCFICGNSGHPDQHWLRIKPSSTGSLDTTPYFPFLEMHEPPQNYKILIHSRENNMVASCYLCYSLLISQWDRYERDNIPTKQRVYWLKRCDNAPFTGADLSTQGEYACQLFGLSVDFTNSHKDTVMSSAMSQITGEDSRSTKIQPTSISNLSDQITQLNGSNIINSSTPHSNPGSYTSSSGTDILDLSMPDKNSSTEVCYVCGDEFRRGSLTHVSAKPLVLVNQSNQPFFPSLMLHSRPPRSRPMDSTGRVQTCSVCHTHLLNQWQVYTSKGIPHGERNYILRKRLIPFIDTSTFICFTCSLEYPLLSMRTLYCYPNNNHKPYYPSLTKIKTPPGALPISSQGTVQVCAVCFKSVPQKHQVTMLMDLPVGSSTSPSLLSAKSPDIRFRPYDITKSNKFHSLTKSVSHQSTSNVTIDLTDNEGTDFILNRNSFRCYVCYEMQPHSKLKWLSTTTEGMNSHAMHFPCLKELSRASESTCIESQGRVLSCTNCTQQLAAQWNSMESNRIPLEHRRYNVPSLGDNNYNSQQISNRNEISSIYCFLCSYHSDLTYARVLYSHPQGRNAPYFPYLLKHEPIEGSEQLREDGSALVCTFCYHGFVAQWREFESATIPIPQHQRTYNHKEYSCYVCTQISVRHNVRSLAINNYPSLRFHLQIKSQALLLENGEYAVVCFECYETIYVQAIEYECFGVTLDKKSYQNFNFTKIINHQDNNDYQSIKKNTLVDKTQGNLTNKAVRKIKQHQTLDNSKLLVQNFNLYNSKFDTGQTFPPTPNGRSFAAALRNLAKQAIPPLTNSNDKDETRDSLETHKQGTLISRLVTPPINKSSLHNESKLSGFQPYKSNDSRSLMPTSVSTQSHLIVNPNSYSPYHAANLYSPHLQHAFRIEEQIYLERCGMSLFSPSPYHHNNISHSSQLYHLQSPLVMSANVIEKMKIDEDRHQREKNIQERDKNRHTLLKIYSQPPQ